MGVKYGREYSDIIQELAGALLDIAGVQEFFDMDEETWAEFDPKQRLEYLQTLSDDVIYALGEAASVAVGSGVVEYDEQHHILKVFDGPRITVISLI